MLNESTIRSFLVLANEGSYTKTARLLYLSQQAVSKQMAKLEEDLECTLFRREQGKLTLSEAGKIYYDAFSRIDGILEEARLKAGQLDDSWGNNLIIGVLDAMDLPPLTRKLNQRFREICPEVKITFKNSSTGLMDWLASEKIDVAFSLGNDCPEKEGLENITLKRLREYLVVSADHPLATDTASYLDFRNEPVFYTPDLITNGELQRRNLVPEGFPTDKLTASDNFLSSSVAVEQMQGVMFLMEGSRLHQNENLRFYPTGRFGTVVLAYPAKIKKRCVRRYISEAKKMFAAGD